MRAECPSRNGLDSPSGRVSQKAFNSFWVDAKLRSAKEMSRRYQAHATPSVVVNGKYILNPDNSNGNFNTMLKIINYLIDKERAANKG